MKLKKLEITGFKSFNEKATIAFPSGISAIVGPNGCGKSNVVDAICWVMGEQSAKQLRGKSMEDVIFSGTNGQAPVNMAEVSLTLLNDNGSAPAELKDFAEIMLTRRVYRSGERAYFINKQPCRLKDIYNIFYGSGMGPKSYAVIQQGNIGAITDAGPEERRYFIEEAAGVTRYKNRKKEALRKVDATNQNLLRLSDILSEINRQMGGLQRQAKKAERFKRYQARIRTLDALLSITSFDALTAKITETERLLRKGQDEEIGHAAQLKKIDAAVERIKLEKEQKTQEISRFKSHLFEKQRKTDTTENDLSHLRETVERLTGEISGLESARQDLEAKDADIVREIEQVQRENAGLSDQIREIRSELDQIQGTTEGANGQLADLERRKEAGKAELYDLVALEARYKNVFQNASSNKDSVQRRLKRASEEDVLAQRQVAQLDQDHNKVLGSLEAVRGEIEALKARIDRAKQALDENSRHLSAQIKMAQALEIERNKAKSRYTALKKMEDNFEWYRDGVRAIMKLPAEADADAPTASSILGLMADIIEPDASVETAVEAVLGESLQYVIVDDVDAGAASIQYLKDRGAGRSGFIPASVVKPFAATAIATGDDRLLDRVRIKPGFERVAEALLGHVGIADDLVQAVDIFSRNGSLRTVVTLAGDVVSHQGIMVGGSPDKLAGILAKKKEIKDLSGELVRLEGELEAARERQKTMESDLRSAESLLQQQIEAHGQARQAETEAEKALYKTTEDLKHARRHLDIVQLEKEQLQGEDSDLEVQMAETHQAVTDVEQNIRDVQQRVSETSQQARMITEQVADLNQKIVDIKLNLTALDARLENSNHTLRRLEAYKNDTRQRYQQLVQDISLKGEKANRAGRQIEEAKQTLAVLYGEIKTIEARLEANEADFAFIDARLRENDSSVLEIQNRRETLLQKIRLLELDRSEQRLNRESIERRLGEQYQATVAEFRIELRRREDQTARYTEMPIPDLEEKLRHTREKISKIVDVNLAAIKEYDQLKERFEFLTGQRTDLVNAVDDLHQVIRKINRITQERFVDTFDRINEKLDVVFPRLFEGGTAKLVMTDPANPLECGVELMIHPPGKKLTRLSLLSGGEKALSAIAFIFSIFLMRPASFCLLDEIDAPLDDANVSRFNNLLQLIGEKSQVVMITHNKRSMEFADTLFGITMERKGISKVVSVDLKRQEAPAPG